MTNLNLTNHPFTTVRDLLRYASSRFSEAKLAFFRCKSATNEAAQLILHTLHLPPDDLEIFLDAQLLPEERADVLKVIERRITERLPAAYITNEAWLGTYSFYVDERVMLPCSFFVDLIPSSLSPWIENPDAITDVLELCTGSGCMSIMLADVFPQAHVDACDISADALAVAKRNVESYAFQDRIALYESDLYSNVPNKKYQLVISNPPYETGSTMTILPQELLKVPQIALKAGYDGMDFVRIIIAGAKSRLTHDGILMVQIGYERAFAEAAFPDLKFTWISTSDGNDVIFLLKADQLPD